MIDPKWEPPEDRANLVKLPSTLTDEKRFEEIINYAMKRWMKERGVRDGCSRPWPSEPGASSTT